MSFAYKIICVPTKKVYYGSSKSILKNYNPLNYFLKCHEEDSTMYSSICESVKSYGRTNHIFQRITVPPSYEIKDFVNKLIEKSKDISLNDFVITDETVVCKGCNATIKKCFKKRHDERYCAQDIDGLTELALYD